jgi:hypothetical protein
LTWINQLILAAENGTTQIRTKAELTDQAHEHLNSLLPDAEYTNETMKHNSSSNLAGQTATSQVFTAMKKFQRRF